jgi:hypothetical protein
LLQVANKSPFVPLLNVLSDETGLDTLYVVIKGTFTLCPQPTLAEKQVPPTPEDVYWGEPATSSLKYASETHLGKRGTDVVLVGYAHAPQGRPVPEIVVGIRVAGRQKVARVLGERKWRPVLGGIMPMVKGAKYVMTTGDEAGSAGGVISGTIKGEAEFMMYSFDVKFEGKNVCRMGDPLFHNKKNIMG